MCVHKCLKYPGINLELDHNEQDDRCNYEETSNAIEYDSCDLSLIQYNIRGINSKIDDLGKLIDSVQTSGQPDIVLICESWLKKTSPRPQLQGYVLERTDRQDKKGWWCMYFSFRQMPLQKTTRPRTTQL